MQNPSDEYQLEDIATDHPLNTAMFVPFAIARLGNDDETTEATLTVELRDITDKQTVQRTLRLCWSTESQPTQPFSIGDRTVTEWAACGVACVLISLYTSLHLSQVAADGDRFDYWVSDGTHEYGLEVSGTTTTDLDARHRAKVRQMLDNPYGVDGFVIVVGFTTRQAIFSFHSVEEG